MDVFVTGGTGFVGSHIVEFLIEAGHEPICLVRDSSDTAHLEALEVETVTGTLRDVPALEPSLRRAEAVVHAAAALKTPDPELMHAINGTATSELAALAAKVNPDLRRFVYLSSIAAQGPSQEPAPRAIDRAPAPVSHYGSSKLEGERGVSEIEDLVPTTIFRIPPVYGPRDTNFYPMFRAVQLGIAPLYRDGTNKTSLVHAFDLARAVGRALEEGHESGAILTIDDGGIHTWKGIVHQIAELLGSEPATLEIPAPFYRAAAVLSDAWATVTRNPLIFSSDKLAELECENWICGNERLKECLNWAPKWPMPDGMKQTGEWYRREGWL